MRAEENDYSRCHSTDNEENASGTNVVSMMQLPVKEPFSRELPAGGGGIVSLLGTSAALRSEEQLEKARRRQEVYLQTRREKKKRKIIYSRVRLLLKFAFSILLIAGIYFAGKMSFWELSLHNITLHGNHLLTQEHLMRFLQAYDKAPIYQINPLRIEQAIEREISLVSDISIRRRLFPVGLDIGVTEKPTWGILYNEYPRIDGALPVDPSGHAEQGDPDADPKPMYLLHWDNTMTDLASYTVKPNDSHIMKSAVPIVSLQTELKPAVLQRYREIAQFLNSRPSQVKLLYLDASNPFDIYARFDGFPLRIGRADSLVMTRLSRFFSLLPTIREHQERIRFVDLRWQQQILFKKKSPEEIAQDKQEAQSADEEIQPDEPLVH